MLCRPLCLLLYIVSLENNEHISSSTDQTSYQLCCVGLQDGLLADAAI